MQRDQQNSSRLLTRYANETLKHATVMSINLRFWLANTERVKKSCQSTASNSIVFAHHTVSQSHVSLESHFDSLHAWV